MPRTDAHNSLPPVLLTIDEACRALRISRSKGYDLISQGKLPVVKLGDSPKAGMRLRPEDLVDFAERNVRRRSR